MNTLVLAIPAFALDAAVGVMLAQLLTLAGGGNSFNPLIWAVGTWASTMAARVVQRVAQDEDFENHLLMHAMGANAAGQVTSVVTLGCCGRCLRRVKVGRFRLAAPDPYPSLDACDGQPRSRP